MNVIRSTVCASDKNSKGCISLCLGSDILYFHVFQEWTDSVMTSRRWLVSDREGTGGCAGSLSAPASSWWVNCTDSLFTGTPNKDKLDGTIKVSTWTVLYQTIHQGSGYSELKWNSPGFCFLAPTAGPLRDTVWGQYTLHSLISCWEEDTLSGSFLLSPCTNLALAKRYI